MKIIYFLVRYQSNIVSALLIYFFDKWKISLIDGIFLMIFSHTKWTTDKRVCYKYIAQTSSVWSQSAYWIDWMEGYEISIYRVINKFSFHLFILFILLHTSTLIFSSSHSFSLLTTTNWLNILNPPFNLSLYIICNTDITLNCLFYVKIIYFLISKKQFISSINCYHRVEIN
jgi:hypothetical protein